MKEKIGNVLLILLGVGVLLYLPVSSIVDLTNKKDVHTVTIHEAYEVLELEHSINGLIPIGTDYYYLGIDDDTNNAYLIKASKKWLEKNFDSNYQPLNSNGIQIKGLVKEVSDYKTEIELKNRLSQLEGIQYPLGMIGCMELNYTLTAILKLVEFLLLIIVFISGRYIFKKENSVAPTLIKVWFVGIIVSSILMIVIIR